MLKTYCGMLITTVSIVLHTLVRPTPFNFTLIFLVFILTLLVTKASGSFLRLYPYTLNNLCCILFLSFAIITHIFAGLFPA